MAAIERAQDFVFRYKESYVWRSDVTKYFDNIVHDKILELIKRRVKDSTAIKIIYTVLSSYKVSEYTENGNIFKKGVPIGNLTSQIFSNIYLNEFDRYVKHTLKSQAYMRYGDDFLIILKDKNNLLKVRELCKKFLDKELKLELNPKNDVVVKVKHGIYFLGAEIFPKGRRLRKRNWNRAKTRINRRNIPSYRGLVMQNSSVKKQKEFNWRIFETIESETKSGLRIKGKDEKRKKE